MDNQTNPHNQYGSNTLTSLLEKTRTPPLLTSSSSTPARAPKGLYATMFDLEADTLNDAGKSEILASRIRPFSYTNDEYLTLDVYCSFKYTDAMPFVFSIQVPISLDPVAIQPFIEEINTPEQEVPPEENLSSMVTRRVQDLFFTPPPTFEKIIKDLETRYGKIPDTAYAWGDKKPAYSHALKLAKNNQQRVLALEGLINSLDAEHEFLLKEAQHIDRSQYMVRRGDPQFYDPMDQARWHIQKTQEERINQRERSNQRIQTVLNKIEEAHNQLPANYRTLMTPNVRYIARSFHAIFELLATNDMGGAMFTYRQVKQSNFTPFVKLAFPNLHAMWHQLKAIFWLIDTHGYQMNPIYPHESIPKDHDLRQHVLSVYVENGSIFCAAITPENTVDRFMLEDAALNGQAETIRGALGCSRLGDHFSEEQKQAVYCAVADRGYYQINYLSPFSAQYCFIQAHDLVKDYHPALAERLQHMVLEPFQRLMDAGKAAKQNTATDIKRAFIDQRRDNIAKKRGTDLQWAQLPSLNDDEWAQLLDLEPTTKPQI